MLFSSRFYLFLSVFNVKVKPRLIQWRPVFDHKMQLTATVIFKSYWQAVVHKCINAAAMLAQVLMSKTTGYRQQNCQVINFNFATLSLKSPPNSSSSNSSRAAASAAVTMTSPPTSPSAGPLQRLKSEEAETKPRSNSFGDSRWRTSSFSEPSRVVVIAVDHSPNARHAFDCKSP